MSAAGQKVHAFAAVGLLFFFFKSRAAFLGALSALKTSLEQCKHSYCVCSIGESASPKLQPVAHNETANANGCIMNIKKPLFCHPNIDHPHCVNIFCFHNKMTSEEMFTRKKKSVDSADTIRTVKMINTTLGKARKRGLISVAERPRGFISAWLCLEIQWQLEI